ncbi:WapI family immunity protein [Dactylosporangium sp. CA-139066]|uniref:WapI family immunity protein n=1 Tax=Dactylosporangium sp. CA-139066 TaxID=3239930 RepID=UPI003D90EF8A
MRLHSRNGAFVELRAAPTREEVTREEVTGGAGAGGAGAGGVTVTRETAGGEAAGQEAPGDATALLVVEGIVDALDGRAWTFRSACLTRDEARLLGDWLLRAAKGRVDLLERLTFPVLSFTLDEHEYGQPRLVVGFSRETAPAWLGDERERTFDYPVTLDLTPESLEAAAVDWEREVRAG